MGRHRQVYCKICLKTMRSDNLPRHLRTHGIEDKRSSGGWKTKINKEALRKIMEKCNQEYNEKINLGATIFEILGENKIKQESIPSVYKEALDLFVKQKQCTDQENGIKKHKCGECKYQSNRAANVRRHIQGVHQGIAYLCEICGFKTAWKDNLKTHYHLKHIC